MKASIDIGTNTALLLVAETTTDAKLNVIREEQRIPRLGKGVDKARHLSDEAIARVISALKEYKEMLAREYPSVTTIQVTATSAVRDAKNRKHFLAIVKQETGLEVQVLSGLEEARYTFAGAKSVLHTTHTEHVVIDIGGGSTEIAYGADGLKDRYSFDVGCVRFTERFLQDSPPTNAQIAECREAVQRILRDYEFNFVDEVSLIGVAGTVTSLAYIDKGLDSYDSQALSGYTLRLQTISDYIRLFKKWPSQKLMAQYPNVMKGRADIFLAGLLILEAFMKKYGFQKLITSTGGIRHGTILDAK